MIRGKLYRAIMRLAYWVYPEAKPSPRGEFTFRDVMNRLGIPLEKHQNWRLGHQLVKIAAKHGYEPDRLLAEKTNPNPSVAAPHCLAHYPMEIFEECCAAVEEEYRDQRRQLSLW